MRLEQLTALSMYRQIPYYYLYLRISAKIAKICRPQFSQNRHSDFPNAGQLSKKLYISAIHG